MPRLPIEVVANVKKAREAAVLAVEIYNRPATAFRSAAYIVLMVVAWTALFHSCHLLEKAGQAVLPEKGFPTTLRAGRR